MLLCKITRNVASVSNKINLSELLNSKSPIVLLGNLELGKRNFSIEQIGKRYDKPYDYKNKQYGLLGQIFDSTLKKLGENSLIITVEGNFGSGKSELAKKLAKEIDFVYAREPDLDEHLYKLPNGVSIREVVNKYVGDNDRFKIDTLQEWHLNPSFKKAIAFQHAFYTIRWMQYRTALLHLLSTGQGVVLERSVFSDSLIAQSLYENNLLSDEAWRFYIKELVPTTLEHLWRPHVVIYLDNTPEDSLKRIRERGKPFEKESKVYSLDLLKSVDKQYKKNFLPEIKNHLHVLNYSNANVNTEKVIEDLELLDFEDMSKFNDWRIRKETTINTYRKQLANYDYCIDLLSSPTSYINVPEYLLYGDELSKLHEKITKDSRLEVDSKPSLFYSGKKAQKNWL